MNKAIPTNVVTYMTADGKIESMEVENLDQGESSQDVPVHHLRRGSYGALIRYFLASKPEARVMCGHELPTPSSLASRLYQLSLRAFVGPVTFRSGGLLGSIDDLSRRMRRASITMKRGDSNPPSPTPAPKKLATTKLVKPAKPGALAAPNSSPLPAARSGKPAEQRPKRDSFSYM